MINIESFELDTQIGIISGLKNQHSANKPTILAVHGWLDNAASFTPLIKQMTEFNWIAIDLPGHGCSAHKPKNSHYHFIDWVSDLDAIINTIKTSQTFDNCILQSITLLGHSMGGLIANVYSALYPNDVKQLITIDAVGLFAEQSNVTINDIRMAFESRKKIATMVPRSVKSKEVAILARKNAGDLTYDSAALITNRNLVETENGLTWRTDLRLKTFSPIRVSESLAHKFIQAISVPTLICLAENGLEAVKVNLPRYQKDYQSLTLKVIEGGHHCHMDNPKQTAQVICKFINENT